MLKYSIAHRNITTVVLGSFLAVCFPIMDRQSDTRHRSRSPRRLPRRLYCYQCGTCGRKHFTAEKIKEGQWWGLPLPVSVIHTPRRDWVAANAAIVTSSQKFVCRISCFMVQLQRHLSKIGVPVDEDDAQASRHDWAKGHMLDIIQA